MEKRIAKLITAQNATFNAGRETAIQNGRDFDAMNARIALLESSQVTDPNTSPTA
jgi:hypothetical protein